MASLFVSQSDIEYILKSFLSALQEATTGGRNSKKKHKVLSPGSV